MICYVGNQNFTWTSRGKLSKVIGQIQVMRQATAYISSRSLLSHKPSSFDNTSRVEKSFRFSISMSGIQIEST